MTVKKCAPEAKICQYKLDIAFGNAMPSVRMDSMMTNCVLIKLGAGLRAARIQIAWHSTHKQQKLIALMNTRESGPSHPKAMMSMAMAITDCP